jgi:3-hydroxyisobutyrate dehydrogenase
MTTIGFIGTGVMGKSMARHLLQGGHDLNLYTRTKSKAQDLLDEGAVWKESPGELASVSDVVITMVGYPEDVKEVYTGENGLINRAESGTLLIDMTTSDPALAAEIAEQAALKNIHVVDAPVSGGDVGARNAELAIMAGGTEEAFAKAEPVFRLLGTNIQHLGRAGAGQSTKMANQIAIASTMMGVSESLVYADKAGLDVEQVLDTIETGAAGSFSLSKLGRRMIAEDFEPGFYVKHFIKDMRIAIESAKKLELELPGLQLAESLYTQLAENGWENAGTQALINYYFQR